MKKVILFCANGFSTAMLSQKLTAACTRAGKAGEYEFSAFPFSEFQKKSPEANIIMLAPQIRFNMKRVQEQYPDRPVILVDTMAYGTMNAEKIFKQVLEV